MPDSRGLPAAAAASLDAAGLAEAVAARVCRPDSGPRCRVAVARLAPLLLEEAAGGVSRISWARAAVRAADPAPVDPQCSFCRGFFSDISYLLEFHEFEDAVRDALRAGCTSQFSDATVPAELEQELCLAVVDAWVPKVLYQLGNFFANGRGICTSAGYC